MNATVARVCDGPQLAHNRLARPTKAMSVQPNMPTNCTKHCSTRLGRLPYSNVASSRRLRGRHRAQHPLASDADAELLWPSCAELRSQTAVTARSDRALYALQAWLLTFVAERHMRGRFARHLGPRGQPHAWRRGRAFDGRLWTHLGLTLAD